MTTPYQILTSERRLTKDIFMIRHDHDKSIFWHERAAFQQSSFRQGRKARIKEPI